jgi:hypothetical protein
MTLPRRRWRRWSGSEVWPPAGRQRRGRFENRRDRLILQ